MAEQDYSELTVDQLKAELEERQLPKSGKKDDLIARLTDDDATKAGTASEPDAEAIAEGSENVEAPAGTEASSAGAEPAATDEADASDDADSDDDDSGDDADDAAPSRRRGSAETSAGSTAARSRDTDASPAPRDEKGALAVRAHAKFVRNAPRKTRLVMDHIRGKDVAQARAILAHTPRAAATDVAKLLESAVANAENNFELDADDLKIGRVYADEGPTIKRFRPRAQGRATPIHKRTSHMTIILTGKDA